MKSNRWLILVISAGFALFLYSGRAQTNTAVATSSSAISATNAPKDLPKGPSDVVKLFQMGKKDNVLIFYVNYSGLDFHLSADHILYLNSVGVSREVISRMLEVDKERRNALVVRNDDDHYFAPTFSESVKEQSAPVASRVEESSQAQDSLPDYTRSVVYPDYSAFPGYYQSWDNTDHHHVSVAIGIGVGTSLGFGDPGFYRGYSGHGHRGGRR
jgi:hypothetical protein